MNQGYIRLYRSLEDWEWIDDPVMFYFWGRILLMANWEDRRWHGKVIQRGSFVTTIASLASKLRLSVKQVRTCLDRLKKGKEISVCTANNYTHVTICKYDDYQCLGANEGQMKGKCEGKERATTKEVYNTSDTKVSSYSIQEENNKKEEDTIVSSQKEPSDFDFVLKLWNDSARRSVPKVRMLSPARKEKVKLRVREMGGWEEAKRILPTCFKKLNDSDFCNGSTGKWTATFDWFFENEKNWMKVLEGNYDNRQERTALEQLSESITKADQFYAQRYGYAGSSACGVPADGWGDDPDEQ